MSGSKDIHWQDGYKWFRYGEKYKTTEKEDDFKTVYCVVDDVIKEKTTYTRFDQ